MDKFWKDSYVRLIMALVTVSLLIIALVYTVDFAIEIRELTGEKEYSVVEVAKNIFHILFFIIISVLGTLSYLQARRSLFTPIKTETYKLQLQKFEKILEFFQYKGEHDFLKKFEFDRILRINTFIMFDRYAMEFFPDEFDPDGEVMDDRYPDITGGVVGEEYAHEHFELAKYEDGNENDNGDDQKNDKLNPAVKLANWKKLEHGFIRYTDGFDEQDKILEQLQSSPLLPKELRDLIGEFRERVHQNLHTVGDVVTEVSKEMPEKYPSLEDLEEADPSWIWNKYNRERKKLSEPAEEISSFINEYLKVESLNERI